MFNILKKKDEKAKTITTYSIDSAGLELLSESINEYGDPWEINKLQLFYADMNYLQGISCTLQDEARFKDILNRMESLKGVLEVSITITTKNENTDI
jgi:hypothetical protein